MNMAIIALLIYILCIYDLLKTKHIKQKPYADGTCLLSLELKNVINFAWYSAIVTLNGMPIHIKRNARLGMT